MAKNRPVTTDEVYQAMRETPYLSYDRRVAERLAEEISALRAADDAEDYDD